MEDQVKDFILLFTSVIYEAFPFVVLGSLIAGILEELVPQEFITRVLVCRDMFPGSRGDLPVHRRRAMLGLIFPMCECGIIPVMRVCPQGLPLSACAYILAGRSSIDRPDEHYYAFTNYDPVIWAASG